MQSLTTWKRWAALAATLCACAPEKNETESSPSTSTGPTTGTTTGTTTVEQPTTTGTSTDGTATGGESESSTSTGGNVDECGDDVPPDADEQCAAQGDQRACGGHQIENGRCVWIPWFPVTLIDDMCTFGDPRGQCAFVRCQDEGCATLSPCGPEGFGGAFLVNDDTTVSVGFANWCLSPPAPAQACIFDFEGQLEEGPPECACLCDPDFPGAGVNMP